MKRLLPALILGAAAALAGCSQPEGSYAAFSALPGSSWPYPDTLLIEPSLPDSVAVGRLAVAVRHTNGYEYRNLWLEISTPMLDTLVTDTVNIGLADDYGRWYGRGIGVSYVTTDTLPGSYCLTRGSAVRVRHIMRVDTLRDIEQIGLIFIPETCTPPTR